MKCGRIAPRARNGCDGTNRLDIEREDWLRAAEENLARTYGLDEPEYRPDHIVEPNPDYQP
jgi:hypothetical protein